MRRARRTIAGPGLLLLGGCVLTPPATTNSPSTLSYHTITDSLPPALYAAFIIIAISALFASIGWLLLAGIYGAIHSAWPASYLSHAQGYGFVTNRTARKYFAFTLIPFYAVCLLCSQLGAEQGGRRCLIISLITFCHLKRHHGWALWREFKRKRYSQAMALALLNGLICGIAFLAWCGLPEKLEFIIPSIEDFMSTLWTAIFVAAAAWLAQSVTQSNSDISRLVQRSKKELGEETFRLARETAVENNADPELTQAVLLAENLQRPHWFRQAERFYGQARHRIGLDATGTYGVMQALSDRPLSDIESIEKAVTTRLIEVKVSWESAGSQGVNQERIGNKNEIRQALGSYTADRKHHDLILDILEFIHSDSR